MGTCLGRQRTRTSGGENRAKQRLASNEAESAAARAPAAAAQPHAPPDEDSVVKEVLTETLPPKSAALLGEGAFEESVCTSEPVRCFSASGKSVEPAARPGPVPAKQRRAPPEVLPAGKNRHQRNSSAPGELLYWREAGGGEAALSLLRRESAGAGAAPPQPRDSGVTRCDAGERSWRGSASPPVRRRVGPVAAGAGRWGRGDGVGRSSSMGRAWPPRRALPSPSGAAAAADSIGRRPRRGTAAEEAAAAAARRKAEEPLRRRKGHEESLENPAVSLECFIFL